MPGVSTKTTCASPGIVSTPWMEVRVVCGLSATIATFCPITAFSRVDLPAFGRPTSDTNPERNLLMSDGLRPVDAHLAYTQFVTGQHFHANAVAFHKLALLGYVSQPFGHQAADRRGLDVFLAVKGIEQI